jgi:NAD(P)-dependent dehydrogenase (short-subunit alcohol dehydrogenase family)
MRFENKNILVIGGSSGIGLNLVNNLLDEGANVYNASRHTSPQWKLGVKHVELNILNGATALHSFLPSQLHGLVYAVGSINLKSFNRISEADFIQDYRLNVVGAALAIQEALPALKSGGESSVVLISSVAATTGMGFHASIAAAKGGLEGFARSLAAELAGQKIRVNVVAPSLTDTPLAAQLLSTPEKREVSAKRHPLGKFGQPQDISSIISFLLSDESSWITGQVIGVDGGMGNLRTNL